MATTTVARPAQAIRQRRDNVPRITTGKRSIANMDALEPASKKRKLDRLEEPYVRDSAYILRKHRGKPPSLIIHLHPTHFRFDGQDGSFAYDSPMKFVIEAMRNQVVPHDMLEELLNENVPFYDGCLIVEVHNHRSAAGTARSDRDSKRADSVVNNKFSMHAYNEHITPSPMVPYPKTSSANQDSAVDRAKQESSGLEKPKKENGKDGPKIATIVLHPTQMTRHIELLLLAKTPQVALAKKRKGTEGTTPSLAQPPTPSLSGPATPLSTTRALSQQQKMCIDEGNMYSFQADMLVATEPPLYLGPAKNPAEAEAILELLSHPLHNAKPPSPKTRKRTTAEMAADDAKAAEEERRMLIMDDRIKPSARAGASTATNENQGAAASLSFSRFKTLEMVRHDQEEKERVKKEEEATAAVERKRNEEQAAQQQKAAAANRQRNQIELAQQQQRQAAMVLHQQQRAAQLNAQRQAQIAQDAHQQANGMMQRAQQGGFPNNAVSMAQSSPIVRQQTPMMNSSPMLANNGFQMAQNAAQNAGSPARPGSAAMHNRSVTMARQASQQHGSQQGTPHMPHGTPNMAQAVPNRQLSQTPHLPPGSPAAGMQRTPNMVMATPNLGQGAGLTPDQVAMLQQRGMGNVANLTPDQIQHLRRQNQLIQQGQMTPQQQQQAHQIQQQQLLMRRRAQQMQIAQQGNQQMLQQGGHQIGLPQTPQQGHTNMNANMMNNMGMMHAGDGNISPHPQGTPMGQFAQQNQQSALGQPQVSALRQQQQREHMARAQATINGMAAKYGGLAAIPQEQLQKLPPHYQQIILKNVQNPMSQMQMRQAQALRASRMQGGGGGNPNAPNEQQVPAGPPNPQYMQTLRNSQAMLLAMQQSQQLQAQQQQQQQNNGGGGNANPMANMGALAMNMNMGGQQGGNGGGGNANGGSGDLTQHFANMQNALNRPGGGNGGGA